MHMFQFLERIALAPDEGSGGSGDATPPVAAEGTPSPSTSPAPTTSPAEAAPQSTPAGGGLKDAPAGEGDFTIPDLGAEDLDVVVIPASASAAPAAPSAPATPPVPPAAAAPAAAPAQEAPKDQQTQQTPDASGQQQTPQAAPTTPAAAAPTDILTQLQQNREALIGELARTHYAISPQEEEALRENAVEAIPKLLAKVHMDAVSAALAHIGNLVPRMIQYQQAVERANNTAREKFFEAWPQLKAHEAEVTRMAKTYRSLNKEATLEDMIRDVGPIVMQRQGIVATPKGNGTPPQPKPAAAFVPPVGSAGGGTTAPPAAVEPNPWEGLGTDFET